MASVGGPETGQQYFSQIPAASKIDFSKAGAAYAEAISNPKERHAEVGVLSPSGAVIIERLGKDEEYGAHRVGSVTKTFTTFLALKLVNDGVLPKGLQTQCKDVISPEILSKVFEDPEAAGNMTLEQLLSHTSGLEFDDHCRTQDQVSPPSSLQERFLQESTSDGGRKYSHVSKPGEGIGFYSNAGLAVAGWMLEAAYNQHFDESMSFSEIMKKELFEEVFGLSNSFIASGPTGDIIQSAAGDMTSSTGDLMKVAARLQEGEASLVPQFGKDWQSIMLKPRDIFKHHGLGCAANAPVIQHAGLNRETFGTEERDVTALVQLPLRPGEPGLVAMCDSNALGPEVQGQKFIRELETSAGIAKSEENHEPKYELEFFCPPNAIFFHGTDYLAMDGDPFSQNPPDKIVCSRNGMKHELIRDSSWDGADRRGYVDENKNPWLFISKTDGRKIIYSGLCLVTKTLDIEDIASKQPDIASVQALTGIYRDAEKPDEHPTFKFTERGGRLFLQEDKSKSYPCLYIPDASGGSWVDSKPDGRKIKIRFPDNPAEPLMITDILTGIQQPPFNSRRTSQRL